MTQNLSPKLLHDLETHYNNVEKLYNDNLHLEAIREELQISYEDWLPMQDVIFAPESIYKCNNVFNNTVYYKYNYTTGRSQEIKNDTKY
jgi:hypothetical protein